MALLASRVAKSTFEGCGCRAILRECGQGVLAFGEGAGGDVLFGASRGQLQVWFEGFSWCTRKHKRT